MRVATEQLSLQLPWPPRNPFTNKRLHLKEDITRMRLLLLLAAAAQLAHGLRDQRQLAATYPSCTAATTALFIDNLSAASNGCTDTVTYKWDGDADPTDAQRSALCKCTVKPLDVPKCHWTKLKKFDVTTAEHFAFAYNCSKLSGKTTPKVTEVDVATTPGSTPTVAADCTSPQNCSNITTPKTTEATAAVVTTAAPAAASAAPDCTVQQLNAFMSALATASGGCMATTSYNWGGSTNPSNAQYAEICKCTDVSQFVIPACSIEKGPDRILLSVHYDWVRSTQCSTFSPPAAKKTSSSKVGLVVGIISGVVVVLLVIAFVLYKRNRKTKQEQNQPYDDRNGPKVVVYHIIRDSPDGERRASAAQPPSSTGASQKTDSRS